jgi:hypothetical protein
MGNRRPKAIWSEGVECACREWVILQVGGSQYGMGYLIVLYGKDSKGGIESPQIM